MLLKPVVAGTKYSPILIIVIFGLSMGFVITKTKIVSQGFIELPLIILISKLTIIVLIVSFFVGGQELHKIIFKKQIEIENLVIEAREEVILGTKRTQLIYIIRSVFILIGIISVTKLLTNDTANSNLANAYPILAYIGFIGSIILIDSRATIKNKALYLKKGILEFTSIVLILTISFFISIFINNYIQLPQIFFAMLIWVSFGFLNPSWEFGPTIKSLLFAGIPTVLSANFLIGGSRVIEALKISEMHPVICFSFFGQLFWMFSGLSALILLGKGNHIRNLAPGMAGSLSHAGLTGACTAGDLGSNAQVRTPIMINVPFLGHIFVFSILAYSLKTSSLSILPVVFMFILLILLNYFLWNF